MHGAVRQRDSPGIGTDKRRDVDFGHMTQYSEKITSIDIEETNVNIFCLGATSDSALPGNKAGELSIFPVKLGILMVCRKRLR